MSRASLGGTGAKPLQNGGLVCGLGRDEAGGHAKAKVESNSGLRGPWSGLEQGQDVLKAVT